MGTTGLISHFNWLWSVLGMPKVITTSNSVIWRMSWVINLVFYMWLVFGGGCKLIQPFQVGVVRYAQGKCKQQVSSISRISWGVKLIFLQLLRHIEIHILDWIHSYRCGQPHIVIPKVIANIESEICQDWREL